jgi:NAD(P)-dependent dehydrogenase (short-subunit alcohol dehydrogenase family)
MGDSVLITGAGTGIGLATSLYLASRGFRVFASIPDLSQQPAVDAAAEQYGVQLRVLQLDVTDSSSIHSAIETINRESGNIFGLVNSAGLGLRGFFEDLSEAEIRRLFDTNVFGAMAVTRAVLPAMRGARRGRIVFITSAGGRIASLTISAYCASKFALEGFGETLALEIAPLNLQVSIIEPGLVMTPHFTTNRGRAQAATNPGSPYYAWFVQHEKMVDKILHSNHITPANVARAVHQSLTAKRPRLRYAVGWRAGLLLALHRHLPEELFRRIYARQLTRMVTKPLQPAGELSNLSLPGVWPTEYLGLDTAKRGIHQHE